MLIADLFYLKMITRSSRVLHSSMFNSILRSTMNFFESTPIGRIINRFSMDVESVENMIPTSFRILIRCLFQVIVVIVMISTTTTWFFLPLIPIAFFYSYIQRYFVASMRQLRRLNSVSKSPIFSHFAETLNGVSTIRAYNCEDKFVKKMEKKIDENLSYYFLDTVSNGWLAIRLEFIGTLITFFSCLFVVIGRETLSGGQAGLSISFSLDVYIFFELSILISLLFRP